MGRERGIREREGGDRDSKRENDREGEIERERERWKEGET